MKQILIIIMTIIGFLNSEEINVNNMGIVMDGNVPKIIKCLVNYQNSKYINVLDYSKWNTYNYKNKDGIGIGSAVKIIRGNNNGEMEIGWNDSEIDGNDNNIRIIKKMRLYYITDKINEYTDIENEIRNCQINRYQINERTNKGYECNAINNIATINIKSRINENGGFQIIITINNEMAQQGVAPEPASPAR